jgi:F0F1-type ATP synthase membrane subunit c/vacuolar-type H+-ATPase subunit K
MTLGLNEPVDNRVEASFRTLRIIWLAIVATVVAVFVVTRLVRPGEARLEVLFWILLVLGLVNLGASFILKHKMLKQAAEQQALPLVRSAYILAFALCEAIGLFGFVAHVVTGAKSYYFLFALSGFGILLHKPQREDLSAAFNEGGEQNPTHEVKKMY